MEMLGKKPDTKYFVDKNLIRNIAMKVNVSRLQTALLIGMVFLSTIFSQNSAVSRRGMSLQLLRKSSVITSGHLDATWHGNSY